MPLGYGTFRPQTSEKPAGTRPLTPLAEEDEIAKAAEPRDEASVVPRRPRTRADCLNGPRPCGFVSCKWHVAIDVEPDGRLRVNHTDPATMKVSCTLDFADQGPHTRDEIAELLGNISRERVRQIE